MSEARPLVGIGVVVVKDGKVLLGKRKNAHGAVRQVRTFLLARVPTIPTRCPRVFLAGPRWAPSGKILRLPKS